MGTVVDQNGDPVAGARVTLADGRIASRNTATTGIDGRYTLQVTVTVGTTQIVLAIATADGWTQTTVNLPPQGTAETFAVIVAGAGTPAPGNAPPSFAGISAEPNSVEVTGRIELSATLADAEGDALHVVALVSTPGDPLCLALSGSGAEYSAPFDIPLDQAAPASTETYTVRFCATDAPNGSNQCVISGEKSFEVTPMGVPPSMPDDL